MKALSYQKRRGQLETYFDRTASEAWARLTSDDPVSRIRATVRAGRDRMRATLLDWMPADLDGQRVLDAGCGTGTLSIELANRGAKVIGIDLSPNLISLARERAEASGCREIDFRAGDMLDPSLGSLDYVVAMDSLIHYRASDMVAILSQLSDRTNKKILFTFAPRTPLLTLMHLVGRLFPRGERAPAIEPIGERHLRRRIASTEALSDWRARETTRISRGFYISQALELVH